VHFVLLCFYFRFFIFYNFHFHLLFSFTVLLFILFFLPFCFWFFLHKDENFFLFTKNGNYILFFFVDCFLFELCFNIQLALILYIIFEIMGGLWDLGLVMFLLFS